MVDQSRSPLSSSAQSIVVDGLYKHFKGQHYKVIAVARHHETLEEFVVYQALYGEYGFWIRPVAMFVESVMVNGQSHPRFQLDQ